MTATPALLDRPAAFAPALTRERAFAFVGERLWLDFVNTEAARATDALRDFDTLISWLEAASLLDGERALGMRRRAREQPSGAAAALVDARRVRAALRLLAERGWGANTAEQVRGDALGEINRVLGRSAGTRRVERRGDGTFARTFVPVGDAFAGLDDSDRRIGGRRAHPRRAATGSTLRGCPLRSRVLRQHEERPPALVRHGHLRQSRQGRAPPPEAPTNG